MKRAADVDVDVLLVVSSRGEADTGDHLAFIHTMILLLGDERMRRIPLPLSSLLTARETTSLSTTYCFQVICVFRAAWVWFNHIDSHMVPA